MSEAAPCVSALEPLNPVAIEHARRLMDDAVLTCCALGYRDLHTGPRDGDWHVLHGVGHPKSSPRPRRGVERSGTAGGHNCLEVAAWGWLRTGDAPPPWAAVGSEAREFVVRFPPYLRQQNWDDWILA